MVGLTEADWMYTSDYKLTYPRGFSNPKEVRTLPQDPLLADSVPEIQLGPSIWASAFHIYRL